MSSPIPVYVADTHPVFREGLARAIGNHPALLLVGEAGDGRTALTDIRALLPRVALLDVEMPGLDGVEVLQAIVRDALPTAVVVLSAHLSAHLIFHAMSVGASTFLTKEADCTSILEAIDAAARGEVRMAPDVQTKLIGELRRHTAADLPRLSPRELEVLRLVAEGLSTPQIAERLILSTATIKTHLQSVYEKLGVSDRASAVATAMRRGLFE
jgi:two-component system nitrate/nitrite response regulator NarL